MYSTRSTKQLQLQLQKMFPLCFHHKRAGKCTNATCDHNNCNVMKRTMIPGQVEFWDWALRVYREFLNDYHSTPLANWYCENYHTGGAPYGKFQQLMRNQRTRNEFIRSAAPFVDDVVTTSASSSPQYITDVLRDSARITVSSRKAWR